MQNVLDYNVVRAGLAFLPHTISIVVGAQVAHKFMARGVDPRLLTFAGGAIASAGFFWQSAMDVDGTFLTTLLGPGVLMSFRAGLMMTPLTAAATSGVPPTDAGVVSGLLNTARTIGGALGLSLLVTVAADRTDALGSRSADALTQGYARAFLVGALVLVLATALVALLPPRPAPRPAAADVQQGPGSGSNEADASDEADVSDVSVASDVSAAPAAPGGATAGHDGADAGRDGGAPGPRAQSGG